MNEKYDARKAKELTRKTKNTSLNINTNDTKFGEAYNRFKRGISYTSKDNKRQTE